MIEFQRLILADTVRNEAFAEALRRVIKKGESVVADVGSGTGYLSFVAAKLGARQCHLFESDPDALVLSKKLAKANGITNCVFHAGHSTLARKVPAADIVISETLGNYALEENILETLQDARRFLKPGGTMIPQHLAQWVAPVTSPRLHGALDIWSGLGFDLDYAAAKELCMNNIYVRTVRAEDLSADLPAKAWDRIDFRQEEDSVRQATLEWKAGRKATVYGLAAWWDCELLPGLKLSTDPSAPATHWEQIFLPFPDPLAVGAGETLRVHVRSDTRLAVKVHMRWGADVLGAKGEKRGSIAMDMARGMV